MPKKSVETYDKKFEYTMDLVKTADIEDGGIKIRGVASVEIVDRDNEIVSMKALQKGFENWQKNPIIRFQHKDPIGKGFPEESHIDHEKGQFVISAMITNKTPKGLEAIGLIKDGIVKSFSIGGRVLSTSEVKAGDGKKVRKIDDIDLYEVSVVDIPANKGSMFEVIKNALPPIEEDTSLSTDKAAGQIQVSEKVSKEVINMQEEDKKLLTKEGEEPAAPAPSQEPKEEEAPKEEAKTVSIDAKALEKMVSDAAAKMVSEKEVKKGHGPEDVEASAEQAVVKTISTSTAEEYGENEFYTKGWFPGAGDSAKAVEDRREANAVSFKDAYMNVTKVLDTEAGGAGTAGFALIPVYVDPVIVDRTRRELPFIELCPRRASRELPTTLTSSLHLQTLSLWQKMLHLTT